MRGRTAGFVIGLIALAIVLAFTLKGKQWLSEPDAEASLRSYLAAGTATEKLPYVRVYPNTVTRMNEAFPPGSQPIVGYVLQVSGPTTFEVGDWTSINVKLGEHLRTYHIVRTSAGYRIDWEASEGWQPTPYKAVMQSKGAPIFVRGFVRLAEQAKDSYVLFDLIDAEQTPTGLQGRIHKFAPDAERLKRLAGDGRPHAALLLVTPRSDKTVGIVEFLKGDVVEERRLMPSEMPTNGGQRPVQDYPGRTDEEKSAQANFNEMLDRGVRVCQEYRTFFSKYHRGVSCVVEPLSSTQFRAALRFREYMNPQKDDILDALLGGGFLAKASFRPSGSTYLDLTLDQPYSRRVRYDIDKFNRCLSPASSFRNESADAEIDIFDDEPLRCMQASSTMR